MHEDNASSADTVRRLTRSALATDSEVTPFSTLDGWLAGWRAVNRLRVERVALDQMAGWRQQPHTGNLVHDSGRFFAVEGLRVRSDRHPDGAWSQPIINQPEVGVLGFLLREFDGVLHCLVQAKAEPGNINAVQLSPTVQATRSNFTRVHGGNAVPHLDRFASGGGRRVLADSIQSEQGSWFLRKRNRNLVVETCDEIAPGDDFRWLTLGQLRRLLREANTVNMDARSVLSTLTYQPEPAAPDTADEFRLGLRHSLHPSARPRHPMSELRSWLADVRTSVDLAQFPIPLVAVERWRHVSDAIRHQDHRYFQVIAVDVKASSREVDQWSQPMFSPVGEALVAFVVRRIAGVHHVLVQARVEAGSMTVAEIAPTVQCTPTNYAEGDRPEYLDLVLSAPPPSIRYDVAQSEEGGRFYRAVTRNLVVEVDDSFPVEQPERFRWMTLWQVNRMLGHTGYLNVEARSLFACLNSLW